MALLFFYDLEAESWGYDPGDRGKWAVVRLPDLAGRPLRPPSARRGDFAGTWVVLQCTWG